jgi:mono/diheme cytochrome c family protein
MTAMSKTFPLAAAACTLAVLAASVPAAASDADRALVARGRYLVQTAGCNDCHTPGYGAAEGQVPESLWLTGDALGWSGPWGTTYPTNLRLYVSGHSEASWLRTARSFKPRPPMPWFNVHAMTERDLRALYRYVRHLGPAGAPVPAYVPPGQAPAGPVVQFPG